MSPAVPPIPAPEPVDAATGHAWQVHRDEAAARLEACLPRKEVRRRAQAYVDSLRSEAPRKNGWQLAEVNGDATPYGVQHLLRRAVGSADAVGSGLYDYVIDHLGDTEGVAILDETSFRKKGIHSAGVARQYSDTADKIANGQVGVFRAYAGSRGYTLVDRALYLTRAWTNDPARLEAVGLAPDTPFATKPELARQLLARAQAAGLSVTWVTGDAVYGSPYALRAWLEGQGLAYVLAVPRNAVLSGSRDGDRSRDVAVIHAVLTEADGQRLSAGTGTKGERWYDGQCVPLTAAGHHRLLFRRSLADPDDGQAYAVWTPRACDLATLVRVAGTRWRIESAFEMAKQEVGLDGYEVRSARGWYRHVTLVLWVLALLSVVRAAALPAPPPPEKKESRAPQSGRLQASPRPVWRLSVAEIRRLLWRLVLQMPVAGPRVLAWSRWRCRHQWGAMLCPYRRQQARLRPYNLPL